jgi:hypothetical protein
MSGRAVSAVLGGITMAIPIAIVLEVRKTRTGWYIRFWVRFLI